MPRCNLVLIVSDLDIVDLKSEVIGSNAFLKKQLHGPVLNIQPDYRYMGMGYYVSMHAEVMGCPVVPSCQDVLDAYRTPIFLLRAKKAGLPVSPHVVSDNVKDIVFEVDYPLILFPLHPTSNGDYRVVHSEGSLYRAVKSLSMNQRYAVCAENLFGRLVSAKSLLGFVEDPVISSLSKKVYEEFRIPVCRLFFQILGEDPYLCSLAPVHEALTSKDLRLLSEHIRAAGKYLG